MTPLNELVQEWLAKADGDLRVGEMVLPEDLSAPGCS